MAKCTIIIEDTPDGGFSMIAESEPRPKDGCVLTAAQAATQIALIAVTEASDEQDPTLN